MKRGRWQGALRILSFNRGWYARGAVAVAIAAVAGFRVPSPWSAALLVAAAAALFWLVASIAISHYVYDRSPLYGFGWIADCLPDAPRHWVNLHAGLNELHLGGGGRVLDIFDPAEMTESSIARARRLYADHSEHVSWRALPLEDESCDAVFLIFTAHELRRHEPRVELLQEAARILRLGGRIVLTEHLRDWWNFLAFGPGSLHFFSQREWLRVAGEAGLAVSGRLTVTPFVHTFVLGRVYDPHAFANCGDTAAVAGRGA